MITHLDLYCDYCDKVTNHRRRYTGTVRWYYCLKCNSRKRLNFNSRSLAYLRGDLEVNNEHKTSYIRSKKT